MVGTKWEKNKPEYKVSPHLKKRNKKKEKKLKYTRIQSSFPFFKQLKYNRKKNQNTSKSKINPLLKNSRNKE